MIFACLSREFLPTPVDSPLVLNEAIDGLGMVGIVVNGQYGCRFPFSACCSRFSVWIVGAQSYPSQLGVWVVVQVFPWLFRFPFLLINFRGPSVNVFSLVVFCFIFPRFPFRACCLRFRLIEERAQVLMGFSSLFLLSFFFVICSRLLFVPQGLLMCDFSSSLKEFPQNFPTLCGFFLDLM